MVVERKLGTENDPDIIESGSSIEIIPEQSRQEALEEALSIVVSGDDVILDGEMAEEEPIEEDFFANLAESLDEDTLSKLASDLCSSIKNDLESRSEWEKTYIDGLKYLGSCYSVSSECLQGVIASKRTS